MTNNTENSSLVTNAAFNVVYKLLNILFPLITAGYVARVLTPNGVGRISVVQNNVSYFLIMAILGIPAYAIRELSKNRNDKNKTDKLFSEMLAMNAVLTTFALTVFLITVFNVDYFKSEIGLHLICGITIAVNYFNVDWYYQAMEQYRFIAVRSIVVKIISLLAVFIFVRSFEDVGKYMLIYSLANCGNYIINAINLRKKVTLSFRKLEFARHLKPLLYLTLYVISIEIYAKIDITMLGIMTDDSMVAYYTSSQKVVNLIVAFVIAITAVFMPRLSYCYSNDRKEFYRLTKFGADLIIFISLPVCCGIISIARPLILLWLGSGFEESVNCLMILAVLIPFKCLGDLICFQVMMCAGKELYLTIPHFISLFVNVVLNYMMIPRHGAVGASISSVISEVFVFALSLFLSRKLQKYKPDVGNIVAVSVSSVAMMFCVMIVCKWINSLLLSFVIGIMAGISVFIIINMILGNRFIINMTRRIRGEHYTNE